MFKRSYFITGGGTGGHIYPAIAVAEELLKQKNTGRIFYIGNPNNLEATIVADKKYKFLPVISSGMPRTIGIELIKWAYKMFLAFIECCKYIDNYRPSVIFGTGGYVSAPVLLAAIVMKVPFIMHDCDANPGLVTRKLSPFAKSISIAFDIAKTQLNNPDCRVNGNPIRESFSKLTKLQARENLGLQDKITICIMGGSQGSKRINFAALELLKELSSMNLQVIFQTGKKNYADTISKLKYVYPEYENDKNLIIKPYFDDMVTVLKACDIAVSRAGSLSISELCACSIAPIFIPYPFAAADHQRKNAKYMVEQGAGLYLEDSETTPKTLMTLLKSLLLNKEKLYKIQVASSKLAKFDGVQKIVKQILEV